ncbi:MAG: acetylornithine/succinylornithine family transaminase [Bacteroidota bacterium]|nr:acetylornithine/succinylornithine family transaminase [Bacteroidota bacterium]
MDIFTREKERILQTYRRLNVEIVRGEGVYLIDRKGKRYLDAFGGLAVNLLGHRHPELIRAICHQLECYVHLSNVFIQEAQLSLADRLSALSGLNRVFYCNSGAEAVEGALKLVRKWGRGLGRRKVVSFDGGFHGRTMGALSLMSQVRYRDGYEPLLAECFQVPFNDVEAFCRVIDRQTAAVFLECIQGERGVIPIQEDLVNTLKEYRRQYGFLLVVDEVQTGLGRTGTFIAARNWDLDPDIVLLAKGLGGGLPLGAILTREQIAGVFGIGGHGSTMGGNPVACRAGCALLDVLERDDLYGRARVIGNTVMARIRQLQGQYPDWIKDVRGIGCIVGVEFLFGAEQIACRCLEKGLLVNVTHGNVIRFLPPLTFGDEHVARTCDIVEEVIHELAEKESNYSVGKVNGV